MVIIDAIFYHYYLRGIESIYMTGLIAFKWAYYIAKEEIMHLCTNDRDAMKSLGLFIYLIYG